MENRKLRELLKKYEMLVEKDINPENMTSFVEYQKTVEQLGQKIKSMLAADSGVY